MFVYCICVRIYPCVCDYIYIYIYMLVGMVLGMDMGIDLGGVVGMCMFISIFGICACMCICILSNHRYDNCGMLDSRRRDPKRPLEHQDRTKAFLKCTLQGPIYRINRTPKP